MKKKKKYKNRIIPQNINRVDGDRTKGFQFRNEVIKHSKLFSDSIYGGWDKSLDAAIKYGEIKKEEFKKLNLKYKRNTKKAHFISRAKKFKKKDLNIMAGICLYADWSKTMNDYNMYFIISHNPKPYKQIIKKINIGYLKTTSENKLNIKYKECVDIRIKKVSEIDKEISEKLSKFKIKRIPLDLSLAIIDDRRKY